jgi:phosphoglycerate dehydrogenase-like enzyme
MPGVRSAYRQSCGLIAGGSAILVAVTVINHLGPDAHEMIAELAGVEVIDLGASEVPSDRLRAEVLATHNHPSVLLDHLDGLGVRWVHLVGTGVDDFPLDRLGSRMATCSRGATAVPIAEYVLAMMLAFEKRIPEVWQFERPSPSPPAPASAAAAMPRLGGLDGRTLGVIGLGEIGTAVARRALAFDMRVVGVRRHPDRGAPLDGVELADDLAGLLRSADHVLVSAPLTPRTHHLLDAEAFAQFKPGAHVINIARGGLIDQTALRVALDDGRVARATLDVTEGEPLPVDHWLRSHPGVRLTPHISWSSPSGLRANLTGFTENLARYLRHEPLLGVIDREEGY